MSDTLRTRLIRLAHTRPDLRPHLLPLVASAADDLEVVRVEPTRAGFGGARMMRNMSRGMPHDPREVVSVEVTLSGTVESLMSRPAMYLAQAEARRHGVHGGMVRRKNNPYRVRGYAEVSGDAKVGGDAEVFGKAKIGGDAEILGGKWDGSEGPITSGRWMAPGVPA